MITLPFLRVHTLLPCLVLLCVSKAALAESSDGPTREELAAEKEKLEKTDGVLTVDRVVEGGVRAENMVYGTSNSPLDAKDVEELFSHLEKDTEFAAVDPTDFITAHGDDKVGKDVDKYRKDQAALHAEVSDRVDRLLGLNPGDTIEISGPVAKVDDNELKNDTEDQG